MTELNDSQKRYLASTLGTIGAYLKNVEELLEQGIDPDERARFTAFIRNFRAEEQALRNQFALPGPEGVARRWSIYTHLEFMTVELMELTYSKLAGYGPLDDDTFLLLNDRIDQLMALVRGQISLLRRGR